MLLQNRQTFCMDSSSQIESWLWSWNCIFLFLSSCPVYDSSCRKRLTSMIQPVFLAKTLSNRKSFVARYLPSATVLYILRNMSGDAAISAVWCRALCPQLTETSCGLYITCTHVPRRYIHGTGFIDRFQYYFPKISFAKTPNRSIFNSWIAANSLQQAKSVFIYFERQTLSSTYPSFAPL